MNTQPEALRLAELLDWYYEDRGPADEKKAAAELRRLHKEVEWMKHNMSNVSRVEQSLIAANERLHAVNTELLKALKDAATSLETISRLAGKSTYKNDEGESFETYMRHHDEVRGYAKSRATVSRATIAKATGEQT